MNSNRYETSFRLKISLRCSVSFLLVFTWTEAKWKSKWYGFQNGMRFSYEQNLPETKLISADSLDIAFNAVIDSYRSFWQKWNFISGDKIPCKHYPKWNAYTCPSKDRVVLKCIRNETSCEQNLFSRRFEISNRYEFISPLAWTYSQSFKYHRKILETVFSESKFGLQKYVSSAIQKPHVRFFTKMSH